MEPQEIAAGSRVRVTLEGRVRTTGGAYQIWRGDELVYQGARYGIPESGPSPDIWRPIGLVSAAGGQYSILFYAPTTAEPGEYELRLATTQGSRSTRIRIVPAVSPYTMES